MEAYYVVGFVDGRGTFKVGRGDNAVRFEAVSKDRCILEDLRDYFGMGRVSILKKGSRRELYRYLVTGEDDLLKIVEFFDQFSPIVRKEEYSKFRERVQKSMDVERRTLFLQERREIYKLYTSGIKIEDIMKRYGISKQRVYNIALYERRKAGESSRVRRLTEKQKEEICRLYREGYSTKSIANRYGKKSATVLDVLSRYGILVDRGYKAQKRLKIS